MFSCSFVLFLQGKCTATSPLYSPSSQPSIVCINNPISGNLPQYYLQSGPLKSYLPSIQLQQSFTSIHALVFFSFHSRKYSLSFVSDPSSWSLVLGTEACSLSCSYEGWGIFVVLFFVKISVKSGHVQYPVAFVMTGFVIKTYHFCWIAFRKWPRSCRWNVWLTSKQEFKVDYASEL